MSIRSINGDDPYIRKKPEFQVSNQEPSLFRLSEKVSGVSDKVKKKPESLSSGEIVRQNSLYVRNVSVSLKGGIKTLSNFVTQTFFAKSEKVFCDSSKTTTTGENSSLEEFDCFFENTESEVSEPKEHYDDLENRLIYLCKDLISIKSSQILLKQGQSLENAIIMMKESQSSDATQLETLQKLSDLDKQLGRYHRSIDHQVFPFHIKQQELELETSSWDQITVSQKSKVATLCDKAHAGLTMAGRESTIEEIGLVIKQLENANCKDAITLSILKTKIIEKKQCPNTSFHQVHLHFLETKRDFLEAKMKMTGDVILDLTEKKEGFQQTLRTLGAENPKDLFQKSWDKLCVLLYNLPIEEKTPLLNHAFDIDDFNVAKALRELVSKGELDQKLNSAQALQLLNEIKNSYVESPKKTEDKITPALGAKQKTDSSKK